MLVLMLLDGLLLDLLLSFVILELRLLERSTLHKKTLEFSAQPNNYSLNTKQIRDIDPKSRQY